MLVTIAWMSLLAISYISAKFAIKIQYLIMIIIALIQAIITANWASSEEEEDYKRVRKLDVQFLVFLFTTFVGGIFLICMFS